MRPHVPAASASTAFTSWHSALRASAGGFADSTPSRQASSKASTSFTRKQRVLARFGLEAATRPSTARLVRKRCTCSDPCPLEEGPIEPNEASDQSTYACSLRIL